MQSQCLRCKQPFKFGIKGDEGVNIYSELGKRETQISGFCELCFDEVTAEPEEDEE